MKRIEWAFRVFPALFLLLALPAFGQKHVDELQQVVLPPPGAVMIVQTGAPPVAAFTCFIYDTNVLYWLQTLPNWGSITNIPLTGLQSGGASVGQVLGFNGTHWAPTAPTSGGGGTNGVEAGTNVVIYFDTNGLPLINAVIGRPEVTNTVLYLIGLSNVYVGTFNGQGYGLVNIPGAAITNAVGTATNWLGLLSPQLYFDKFYGYAAITNGLDMLKGGMSMFSGTSQTFQSGAIWQYIKNAAGGWIWEGNGSGIGDWSRDASQLTNAGAGYVTGTLTNPIASVATGETFTIQPFGSVLTIGTNFFCYTMTNGNSFAWTNGILYLSGGTNTFWGTNGVFQQWLQASLFVATNSANAPGSWAQFSPTNIQFISTNAGYGAWSNANGTLTVYLDGGGAGGNGAINAGTYQALIAGNAVNIGAGSKISVNGVVMSNDATNTAGLQRFLRLASTVDQGGTASYTGIELALTVNTTGSGPGLFFNLIKNGTSAINITNDGSMSISGTYYGNGAGLTNVSVGNVNAATLGGYITKSIPIAATAFYTNNQASPATDIAVTNASGGWAFASAATNTIRLYLPIPGDWNGQGFQADFQFLCTGTNHTSATNVVLYLKGAAIGPGDNIGNPTFGTAGTVTNHVSTAAWVPGRAVTASVTLGNSPTSAKMMLLEIGRNGGMNGDTMTNTFAALTGVNLWYQAVLTNSLPTASP